jgi:hypothetical protein
MPAAVHPNARPPSTRHRLCSLELPTADFQDGVQLTPLRRQRGGTAIIVQQVAPGSACAAAGVRPGQQLLAISDPIRQSEVWELNGLASIKYVRQAISGRSLETLNVRLSPKPVPEWGQAVEAARAAGGGEGYGAELTVGELAAVQAQLERMQEEAEERKKAVRMGKVERRQGYEKEVSGHGRIHLCLPVCESLVGWHGGRGGGQAASNLHPIRQSVQRADRKGCTQWPHVPTGPLRAAPPPPVPAAARRQTQQHPPVCRRGGALPGAAHGHSTDCPVFWLPRHPLPALS